MIEHVALGNLPVYAVAKDRGVSVKYTPHKNWAIAADIHLIEGTGRISIPDNSQPRHHAKNWTLLALMASYTF